MIEKSVKLNPDSSIPLYKQLVKSLNSEIEQRNLKDGERLPSELELMEIYGVSRITVRTAIDELQEMGIVKRSRGKGTFVASKIVEYSADDRIGFTHSCALAGKKATTEVLDISWIYPNISDIQFLQVDEDEVILATKRLRCVDDVPTMIETNHFTKEFTFLENEDLSGSLYDILKKHGASVGKSTRTLEVCHANQQEAALLNIKKGDALLLFTDKHMDENGNPKYISKQLYCTERLKFYL